MTSINNGFGNLTAKTGQTIKFDDIDKNKDGKITQEEWTAAQTEYGFDAVSFVSVNSNTAEDSKNVVDKDEFAILEQKIAMSEYVSKFCDKVVGTDTQIVGTGHVAQIKKDLIAYIDEFATSFTGDTATMAEQFKAALNTKYTELVTELTSNTGDKMPVALKDAIEDKHETFVAKKRTELLNTYPAEAVEKFIKGLEAVLATAVEDYMKTWTPGTTVAQFSNGFVTLLNKEYANYCNDTENSAEYADLAAIVTQAQSDDYISSTDVKKIQDAFVNYLSRLVSDGNTEAIEELGLDPTNWAVEISKMSGEQLVETFNKVKADLSNLDELNKARADKLDTEAEAQEARNEQISKSIDNVLNNLLSDVADQDLKAEYMNILGQKLEGLANAFAAKYDGPDDEFVTKLEAYLNSSVNDSDKARIEDEYSAFKESIAEYGNYIDSKELTQLKEDATEFLKQAIADGVIIKLGGVTVSSEAQITTALNKFNTGKELLAALEEAYNALSEKPMLQSVKDDVAESRFQSVPGSAYQVDAATLDYSVIDGYFNGGQIYERGKGFGGSKDKAIAVARNILNQESFKNQLRDHVKAICEQNGIPFEEIEAVFENVYSQSISNTVNAEGMVTGRGARGCSSKGKAYINIKQLIDTFVQTFNTNIAKAIDEMKASNKDLDIIDVNVTPGVDSDGDGVISEIESKDIDGDGVVSVNEESISEAMQKGSAFVTFSDAIPLARKLIKNIEPQMKEKAKNMCEANGVPFDESVFNTIYSNTTENVINSSAGQFGYSPRILMNNFLQDFKTNYTSWVEGKKPEKE